MLLNYAERELLAAEVATRILDSGGPYVRQILGPSAVQVPGSPVPLDYARSIVTHCVRSGWVENPPLLVRILQDFAFVPQLHAMLHRVQTARPTIHHQPVGLWRTTVVGTDIPFLNRDETRRNLEDCERPRTTLLPALPGDPRPARVLVVRGPSGSGKSHTVTYLQYLAQMAPLRWGVARVNCSASLEAEFGQTELVRLLVEAIAPESPVKAPRHETGASARLAEYFVEELLRRAEESGKTWYLVLDDFHQIQETDSAHVLIQTLVSVLTTSPVAGGGGELPIRLVLLGYSLPLPVSSRARGLVREEELAPLSPEDVEHFLQVYSQCQGWPEGIWPQLAALRRQIAAQLVAQSPPLGAPERNAALTEALLRLTAAWVQIRPAVLAAPPTEASEEGS